MDIDTAAAPAAPAPAPAPAAAPAPVSLIPFPAISYTTLPVLPCQLHDFRKSTGGTRGCPHCKKQFRDKESTLIDSDFKRFHIMCFVAASAQLPEIKQGITEVVYKEQLRSLFPDASDMKLTRLCSFHDGKPILLDNFDVVNQPLLLGIPYYVDIKLKLLEIVKAQWPAFGDPRVSTLVVNMTSESIQEYTQLQKDEVVRLSKDLFSLVTTKLYENAGSYTRAYSSQLGYAKGMVYDTSLIMGLFVVMLKRLDQYAEADGIDSYELHLRALKRAKLWMSELYREHIHHVIVRDAGIYQWTKGSHTNPAQANLGFLRAFKEASEEMGWDDSHQFCISAVLASVMTVGCDHLGRPWQPVAGAISGPDEGGAPPDDNQDDPNDPENPPPGRGPGGGNGGPNDGADAPDGGPSDKAGPSDSRDGNASGSTAKSKRASTGKGSRSRRSTAGTTRQLAYTQEERNIIGRSSDEPMDSEEEEDEKDEEMQMYEGEEGDKTYTADGLSMLLASSNIQSPITTVRPTLASKSTTLPATKAVMEQDAASSSQFTQSSSDNLFVSSPLVTKRSFSYKLPFRRQSSQTALSPPTSPLQSINRLGKERQGSQSTSGGSGKQTWKNIKEALGQQLIASQKKSSIGPKRQAVANSMSSVDETSAEILTISAPREYRSVPKQVTKDQLPRSKVKKRMSLDPSFMTEGKSGSSRVSISPTTAESKEDNIKVYKRNRPQDFSSLYDHHSESS